MGPFVMGPFVMGTFVMGPLVMGPYVGSICFKICLTDAGAPSRGGAGPVTVTVSDPSGTPV
jgi:hypothetical protein